MGEGVGAGERGPGGVVQDVRGAGVEGGDGHGVVVSGVRLGVSGARGLHRGAAVDSPAHDGQELSSGSPGGLTSDLATASLERS
jgi:hypothetical protein